MTTIGKGSKLARFRFRDGVEVLVRYDTVTWHSGKGCYGYVLGDVSVPHFNVLYVEWDVGEETTR